MAELELDFQHAAMIVAYAELEREGLVDIAAEAELADRDHVGLGTRLTEAGVAALAEVAPEADPRHPGAPAFLAIRYMDRQAKDARRRSAELRAQVGAKRAEIRKLEKVKRRLDRSDQRTE